MFPRIWQLETGSPLSPGVATLVDYLDGHLEAAWRILVHPRLEGVRLDVIVFHPLVGMTIFEVTDLAAPPEAGGGEAPFHPREADGGVLSRHSLSARAEHARRGLVRLMTEFAPDGVPDPGSVALIRTAAYAHGLEQAELDRALLGRVPTSPCFATDALTASGLARIVPGAHRQRRGNWSPVWNEFLLDWLRSPHHEPERQYPLDLTPEQRQLAIPEPGHRGLTGPVGSGKSRVLAWRAARLASEGMQVLVVCATPGHRLDLRAMLSRTPIAFSWQHVVVTDLETLCRGLLVEAGEPEPGPDEGGDPPCARTLARSAEAVLGRVPHRRVDAVLVDEGQLFHLEAYRLLTGLLTARDEFWIACDEASEAPFPGADRPSAIAPSPPRDLLRVIRRWSRLTTVHARPVELAWGATLFGALHGLEVAYPNLQEQRAARDRDVPGLKFEWRTIRAALWFEELVRSIRSLVLECARPADLTVLLPEPVRGLSGTWIRDRLKASFDRILDLSEHPYPTRRAPLVAGLPRLEVSHVHAFEDWDRSDLILLVPEYHPSDDVLDVLVYTVLSRARKRVHVLDAGPRYREFVTLLGPSIR